MIKDTNPDHYKVDGANFIEYMNDPKISGFGNWMFANGFNSGVWASSTNTYKENPCLYCGVLLAEKEKLICPYCEKRKEYERVVGNRAD